jgi:tyrosyl-DNA phosphodiesterase 2
MQAMYEKALRAINAKKKDSVPWERDEPHPQPYYTFSQQKNGWVSMWPVSHPKDKAVDEDIPAKLSLYTWNVDFMLPHPNERMNAALAHLASIIRPTRPSALAVMFLQEMLESDLTILRDHPGIRAHFYMTDITAEHWESGHYGTVTLIDKRLPIEEVFRVHYTDTKMERDALFVDILHPASPKSVRFCNTHLESLIADPPLRPLQTRTAAKFMHDGNLVGSILAGDLNAIQPFDRTLHSDNRLKDAYLELGGNEEDEKGHTWGQQAATNLRTQFGTSRMDKVFFCGVLEVKKLEHFGVDVIVEDTEIVANDLMMLGLEKAWVTDHLGVRADFELRTEGTQKL